MSASGYQSPQPMDISNVEGPNHYRGKTFKQRNNGNKNFNDQRDNDLKNNACFTCHKPGCRPWKHLRRETRVTNAEICENEETNENISSDESEN